MPCSSAGEDEYYRRLDREKFGDRQAALCALLSHHGTSILDGVNWKEAGTTKAQTLAWWEDHKKKDAERRLWEREEALRKERKARDTYAQLSKKFGKK